MLKDITLGQYFPGDSAIHRMDPRMKLILTIIYIVGVFMVANLPGYAIALAFLYLVVRLSGIQFSYLLKGIKPLRFIIIFTFLLNLFFVQGETPLVSLGFFTLTKEALENAIYFALRLVFLVMGTSVLTLIKICTALQVSSDYLLFGHEENSAVSARLIDRIQRLPDNYYALVDQYLNLLLATDSQPGNLADENQAPQETQETDYGTSDQTTE
jgi:hypothetical protein